jgi:hypothetical protein
VPLGWNGHGQWTGQGAAEKKPRENDVKLRQLAKKSTYVPSLFFLFFFSAFLGVSRQGVFKNTRKEFEYVSKKNHRGNIFFGGGSFFWVNFSTPFPFDFFVALVKRLSVRGTQKRDKKSFTGSCV